MAAVIDMMGFLSFLLKSMQNGCPMGVRHSVCRQFSLPLLFAVLTPRYKKILPAIPAGRSRIT